MHAWIWVDPAAAPRCGAKRIARFLNSMRIGEMGCVSEDFFGDLMFKK
jgi:hypothetical protein